MSAVMLILSLLHNSSGLLCIGSRLPAGLLNRSVARLGKPGIISVDLICNKEIYMSVLVSKHFFMVLFYKHYASTSPLLWWLYDDCTVWCMPSPLQKFLNFSDMKFVPASETILLGIFWKIILHVCIGLAVLNPTTCFMNRNLLW